MAPPAMDAQIFQFDIWETLDEESLELTQTSEFWTQVHYEAERLDLVPPANSQDLQDSDCIDWQIMDAPEEQEIKKENIVHHDCMWAGSCADSVHPGNTFVPAELMAPAPAPGQSLLRRNVSPGRPDTPPSLDGDEPPPSLDCYEPPPFRHAVDVAGTALRLLRDSAAVAADHSYTLARQHFDYLGVQTPSDSCESEEEIDVVSVGTTSSQSLVSACQVNNNECMPRTPERQRIEHTVVMGVTARGAGRKRPVPPPSVSSGSSSSTSSGSGSGRRRARGPGRRGRRSNTDTDSEAECPDIERRSMHNDMERLRRIGLKNLFDELKKQVPATRDKERAPKVVILREAAALCHKLREEEIEREYLKKQQNKLITKLKKLRTMLSVRYRPY